MAASKCDVELRAWAVLCRAVGWRCRVKSRDSHATTPTVMAAPPHPSREKVYGLQY